MYNIQLCVYVFLYSTLAIVRGMQIIMPIRTLPSQLYPSIRFLYNGWQFIGSPAIGYLKKVSPFPSSLFFSRGASTHGPRRNNLILKVSQEISNVVAHPLMEIVLQLVPFQTHYDPYSELGCVAAF